MGFPALSKDLNDRHRIFAGRRRVTGTVRKKYAIRVARQNVLGAAIGRDHSDFTASGGEAAQDIVLGAVIDGDHMMPGRSLFVVSRFQRPA